MKNKLVILGGAESGIGAAILGKRNGLDVFVSDMGKISPENKARLDAEHILYEENGHSLPLILEAFEVVKSPGVPEKAQVIQRIRSAGIPVISEIEFAARYTNATIIAITGSNGKTTTTSLTYHLLKTAGYKVAVAGNIGNSFAMELASGIQYDFYVLEISSFQLDDIVLFKPHIAVITNITPDHLDRYNYSVDLYSKAKLRITLNQHAEDHLIYSADSPELTKQLMSHQVKAQPHPFSLQTEPENGIFVKDNSIVLPNKSRISLDFLTLKGKHNLYNTMVAVAIGHFAGIENQAIESGLLSFEPLEHRLEPVAIVNGVEFINDSKATNIDSAWFALDAMNQPVIWIAGGTDKGNDYSVLEEFVKTKVKAIVCLGVDNSKIHQAFGHMLKNIIDTKGADEAVQKAFHLAEAGDVVLLSPACASFDLFQNYMDRGRQFKESVRQLEIVENLKLKEKNVNS